MSVVNRFENTHLPVFFLLISLFLVLVFIVLETQDAKTLQSAVSQYKQQALLEIERPIYVEFIARRLNIEQLGSAAYLSQLQIAATDKDPDIFIALLLKDRFFYPYLLAEGRLFMNAASFKQWQTSRQEQINPLVEQLSTARFALNPEYKGISNLVSYMFVESSRLWMMTNIFILLLCGSLLEKRIGRSKAVSLFLGGIFGTASLYLLFAEESSAVLQGVASGLCVLLGACLLESFLFCRERLFAKKALFWLALYTLVTISYLSAQVYFEKNDINGLRLFIMALFLGAAFYLVLQHWVSLVNSRKAAQELELNKQMDRPFRIELALVLDAIAAFNFNKAREKLKQMSEHYPKSPEVMEQRYHLEKLYPDEGVYWNCARDLVNYAVVKNDYARMSFIFSDIQKNAPSKQRAKDSLEPEFYHKMMMVFVKYDDMNKAEHAFLFLELAGQKEIIKDACQLLIQQFKNRGTKLKERQYQMLFEGLF